MTERTVALDAGYIESHGADTACPERSLWRAVLRQAAEDLFSSDEQIRADAIWFFESDDLLQVLDYAGFSASYASTIRDTAKAICQQSGRLHRRRITFRGESRTVRDLRAATAIWSASPS